LRQKRPKSDKIFGQDLLIYLLVPNRTKAELTRINEKFPE